MAMKCVNDFRLRFGKQELVPIVVGGMVVDISTADLALGVGTGAWVIAGSTRLKAGTVQKVVLNMLSTGVFTLLGHTYRGRMIDVVASNEKPRGRAARIVTHPTGAPGPRARRDRPAVVPSRAAPACSSSTAWS